MKTYKSHKTVQAAKILHVTISDFASGAILTLQGDQTEVRESVTLAWLDKNCPTYEGMGAGREGLVGGYFVRYPDGYTSWSPAQAFEEGYTEHSLDPKEGALPVAGYKPQTGPKVALVNHFKAAEETLLRTLDALKNGRAVHLAGESVLVDTDPRWLQIGRTSLEQAFMAINRSVFQPGRASLPEDAPQGG